MWIIAVRALPEHCGRAGGSWQFSRVSCREGSSRKRFGAKLVARALRPPHRVLHTRQDWPPATEVLQIDRRSSLRRSCLPSGIVLRALFGAQVRDELPHASCVEMGDRTFRAGRPVGGRNHDSSRGEEQVKFTVKLTEAISLGVPFLQEGGLEGQTS